MSLTKWEPFNGLDRAFGEQFTQPFSTFSKVGLDLSADVYEEKGNVVAKMSLPGVKQEEVDISIEDNVLTVSGRREEEKETKEKDYYSKEIRRGSFSRSVSLPKSVEAKKANAKFEDGMLVVTVPVIKGAKDKAVRVKVSK